MGLPEDTARYAQRRAGRADGAGLAGFPGKGPRGRLHSHPLMRAEPLDLPDNMSRRRSLAPQQVAGGSFILAGVVAMMLGWWGMSGTEDLLHQFSYLMSGGVMGAAVVAMGLTVILGHEHARDRAELGAVLDRLDQIERQVGALSDHLTSSPRRVRPAARGPAASGGNGKRPRATAPRPPA